MGCNLLHRGSIMERRGCIGVYAAHAASGCLAGQPKAERTAPGEGKAAIAGCTNQPNNLARKPHKETTAQQHSHMGRHGTSNIGRHGITKQPSQPGAPEGPADI